MKILIVAGGYATRLYPLTLNQPKALLKVGGVPILERILETAHAVDDIDEIVIVTNEKFHKNFEEWKSEYEKKADSVPIKVLNNGTTADGNKLGPLGEIEFSIENADIDDDLMVLASDNLFDLDLNDFVDFFKEKNSSVLAVYDFHNPEVLKKYGVVEVDDDGAVVGFEEKPENPKSNLASTFIYLLRKEDLKVLCDFINNDGRYKGDINAGDLWIHFLKKNIPAHAFSFDGDWYDIGSHEQLKEADEAYSKK